MGRRLEDLQGALPLNVSSDAVLVSVCKRLLERLDMFGVLIIKLDRVVSLDSYLPCALLSNDRVLLIRAVTLGRTYSGSNLLRVEFDSEQPGGIMKITKSVKTGSRVDCTEDIRPRVNSIRSIAVEL